MYMCAGERQINTQIDREIDSQIDRDLLGDLSFLRFETESPVMRDASDER